MSQLGSHGRGGVPIVKRLSVDTTGYKWRLPAFSTWMSVRVLDFPCRVYFNQQDFDNDQNYVLVPVPSASTPYGEFTGPLELIHDIYFKGQGGTATVELVITQRRG